MIYLIAQPWYAKKDISFLFEPTQYQLRGFDVVSWQIAPEFHHIENNYIYIGLTSNTVRNAAYNPAVDDYLTTQIKYTFDTNVRFWQQYDKLEQGAMVAVTGNGGSAIGYANLFSQWTDTITGKSFWWQANYFDERGAVNKDSVYVDHFTGDAALASDIGNSVFSFPLEGSNTLATQAWQDMRFYGVGQTQSQFDALLDALNADGAGLSGNPNDYIMTAAGHAPELAFADSASWMMHHSENFFVRGG
jgi:hypothetical protein